MDPGYACPPTGRPPAARRCQTARVSEGHGGVAARLLRAAQTADGLNPLVWVGAPLRGRGRVLDLVCGAGPLAAEVGEGWLGMDVSVTTSAPAPVLRATPARVPLRTNAVDAVVVLLAFPLLPDLEAVFVEIRRVLRPAGTLVALVPSVSVRSAAELRLARLLRPVRRGGWPNRSALDNLHWILASADFAVLSDDRVPFYLPLPDAAAAHHLVEELPLAGLWPPGLDPDARHHLASELALRAGPDRYLPMPLRRFVARR